MGRLNSFIKFVVVNVNVLLFLGGLGTIGVAAFVLQADFIKLAEAYIKFRGIIMAAFGVLITAMSVIGCLGAHRQIRRDLAWSGRRILTLYQFILVAVVVGQAIVLTGMYRIEVNLEEAAEGLPGEYGEFEGRIRTGFNSAYFDQLCPASTGGESWLWSLASESCPGSIPEEVCLCSTERSDVEVPRSCTNAARYTMEECCPDEELCDAGTEAACPYSACRTGILELLLDYITPARRYATFVVVLEGVVLILTCLLICYNPRDSTEDILIKTGALVRPPGELSLKGAGSSAPGDAIALKLVQLDTGGGKEGTAAGSPGRSTPLVSPPRVDPPSEPLRQFMTPRHTTKSKAHLAGIPDIPQDKGYEFKNTAFVSSQKKGRAAGISPNISALRVGPMTASKNVGAVVLGAGEAAGVNRKSGDARRIAGVQGSQGSHSGEEPSPGAGSEEQRKEAEQLQAMNIGKGEAMHAKDASQEGETPRNAPCELERSRYSAQTPISSPVGKKEASRSKLFSPASTIEKTATPRQETSVPLAAQALSQASWSPLPPSAQTPLSSPVLTPAGGTDGSHAGMPNDSTLASSQSLLSTSPNASAIPSAIEQRHRAPRLPDVDPEIEVPAPNSIGHPHSRGSKASNNFRFMTQTPITSPHGHRVVRMSSGFSLGSAEGTLPSSLSASVRSQTATGPRKSLSALSISPIAQRELHGAPPFSHNVVTTNDQGPGASDRSGVLAEQTETEGIANEKFQNTVLVEPSASSSFLRFLAQAQTLISPASASPTTPPHGSPLARAPSSVDGLESPAEKGLITPAGAASPVEDITLLSPPQLLPASTLYLSPEPGVDRMTDGGGDKRNDHWNPASTSRPFAS